jgi:hypothetical protein
MLLLQAMVLMLHLFHLHLLSCGAHPASPVITSVTTYRWAKPFITNITIAANYTISNAVMIQKWKRKKLTPRIWVSSEPGLPATTTQYHVLVSLPAFEYPEASQPSSVAVMLRSCGNSAPHSTLHLKLLRNWAHPNLSCSVGHILLHSRSLFVYHQTPSGFHNNKNQIISSQNYSQHHLCINALPKVLCFSIACWNTELFMWPVFSPPEYMHRPWT